ncbi:MAG: YbjN domain-containing protein [Ignavibacterium sp.]|jgi:hypothetical protein|nr:YbjN domain-containing protein [Ignavibacterium sp.]
MYLSQTSELAKTRIRGLSVDPIACSGQKPGQWSLISKVATEWIDVFNFETNPGRWIFQVMSLLIATPDENQESIYQNLLKINRDLYGSSTCKKDEWIYVMSLHEADGLDQTEVNSALDKLAFSCSDYKDKLIIKYVASWLPIDSRPSGSSPA